MKTNKQHLLPLIAATALLAACTSVDETDTPLADSQTAEQQPINFGAYVNRSTTRGGRAGSVSQASLQVKSGSAPETNEDGFGVFAYYTDNGPYSFTALPNFMYNQQVTYDTDHWTYSPLKYWPNEHGSGAQSLGIDRLSFFAYAPYTAVDDIGYATTDPNCGIVSLTRPNENGYPYVRYYVSTDPSKCVDLCWADPAAYPADPSTNTEAVEGTLNMTKPAVNTNVDFKFKHALAALNVQIDADVNVTDHTGTPAVSPNPLDTYTRIYVRSITFTGFATKGQLNLYNGAWNNLECDCDVTSAPITIYDGRWDSLEGVATSPNENPTGLNPSVVQWCSYDELAKTDSDWSTLCSGILTDEAWAAKYFPASKTSERPKGVTNVAVNLFNSSTKEDPIYVIPTNVPVRVTIVYDVETLDPKLVADYLSDGVTHGSSIQNTITATVMTSDVSPTPLKMESGKQYTIGLHLGMTSVKVDVTTVDGWVETDPVNVELPNNTPTP